MNIQFAEEQEQLKQDSEKLALNKSCNNCTENVDYNCPVWNAITQMLPSHNCITGNECCSLHERKE